MDRRPPQMAPSRRWARPARRGESTAAVAFAVAALAVALLVLVFTAGRRLGQAEALAPHGDAAGNLGTSLERISYEELTVDRGELN